VQPQTGLLTASSCPSTTPTGTGRCYRTRHVHIHAQSNGRVAEGQLRRWLHQPLVTKGHIAVAHWAHARTFPDLGAHHHLPAKKSDIQGHVHQRLAHSSTTINNPQGAQTTLGGLVA